MSEIADIYAKQIDSRLNFCTSIIRAAADQVSACGGPTNAAAQRILQNTAIGTRFTEIKTGFPAAELAGQDEDQQARCQIALASGRSVICAFNKDGAARIAVIVPVMKNGKTDFVVTGILDASVLDDTVNRRIFGGQGYGAVVSSNGGFIVRSAAQDAPSKARGDNLFAFLSKTRIYPPYDYNKIRSSFNARKRFYYERDNADGGAARIVFVNPISSAEWNVLVVVPEEYVADRTAKVSRGVVLLVFCMSVMFAFILLIIIITERRRRRAGEAAAARRELLISNIPGGVQKCAMDEAFTYEYVSDNFAVYAGCKDKAEFLAACAGSFWNSIHPDDAEKTKRAVLEQLDRDGRYEVVYRLRRKDGAVINLLCKGSAVTDENGRRSVCGVTIDVTRMYEAANELRVSEERYRAAISRMDITVLEYDAASDQMLISGSLRKTFGWPPVVPEFSKWIKNFAEDGGPFIEGLIEALKNGSQTAEAAYDKLDASGASRYLHSSMNAIRAEDGTLIKAVGVTEDWTKRRELELKYTSSGKYKNALAKLYDRIFEIDITHDKVISGGEYEVASRINSEKGSTLLNYIRENLVHPDFREAHGRYSSVDSLRRLYASGVTEGDIEYRSLDRPFGEYAWRTAHILIYTDPSDGSLRTLWFIKDTDKMTLEMKELKKLVVLDPLTGLYNKESTNRTIINRLASQDDDGDGACSALLLIDLDDFKKVNDQMGHIVGDAILLDLASRLKDTFRSDDIIGRVGGDEFVVFMSNLPNSSIAVKKAEELCRSLITFRRTSDNTEPASVSVGIAFAPADGNTFETLYKNADSALYRSKDLGKGRVSLYDARVEKPAAPRARAEGTAVDAAHVERDLFFNAPARYIQRLIDGAKDKDAAVRGALELAVRLLGATRGYIFENSRDNSRYSEIYEVVGGGDNSIPTIQNFQNLSYEETRPGYDKLFENKGLYIVDIKDARPDLREQYERQGMIKLLQVAIMEWDVFRGFVGFDFCDKDHLPSPRQISHLTIIGEILAATVAGRMKEKRRLAAQKNIEQARKFMDNM